MGCCRKRSRIRVDHWLDQTLTSEHLIGIFSYESKTPWTCSCFWGGLLWIREGTNTPVSLLKLEQVQHVLQWISFPWNVLNVAPWLGSYEDYQSVSSPVSLTVVDCLVIEVSVFQKKRSCPASLTVLREFFVHKKLQSLIFIPLLVFTKMSQSLLGFTISELASLKLRCLWKFPSHQRLRAWFKHEWPFIAKGVDLIHIHYDWFVSSIQAALTHNHPSKTKPLSLQRSSGA